MDSVGQRISFIFGFPDPASLPADEVAAVTARVLGERGQAALQYGDNAGYSGLIDALLAKLARDQGIRARRENVLITAGGSQAIDLLLDALVDWGDTIVSEMPTWIGAVQAFRNVGANIVSVPVDSEGIDVTVLDRELRRLRDHGTIPKFIYANANFQNPTGATMSLQRRQDLLALARAANTLLIEDDAYFDLRYDGEATTHHLFARRQRLRRLYGHPVEDHGSRHAARLASGSSGAHPPRFRAEGRRRHERVRRACGSGLVAGEAPSSRRAAARRLPATAQPDARRTRASHASRLDVDDPGWRVLHLADAPS